MDLFDQYAEQIANFLVLACFAPALPCLPIVSVGADVSVSRIQAAKLTSRTSRAFPAPAQDLGASPTPRPAKEGTRDTSSAPRSARRGDERRRGPVP